MLISADNHVFPCWAPDWLREAVENPDCSNGTHPGLRHLAKWLTVYFAEHEGEALRWLRHAADRCDREVPNDEVDRLLLWAQGLFGQTGFSHKQTAEPTGGPAARAQVNLEEIERIALQGPRLAEYRASSPLQLRTTPGRNTGFVLDAWARYAGQDDPWVCFGADDCFWSRRLSRVRKLLHVHAQIVPSPMRAQFGMTQAGRQSEHSKDGVGERVCLVCEFDFVKSTPRGKPLSGCRYWNAAKKRVSRP